MTDISQGAPQSGPPSNLDIIKPFAAAALRHVLTAAGGALAAHGVVSSGTSEQMIGLGMTLGGILWSWYEKRGRAQLLQTIGDLRAILADRAAQARARTASPAAPTSIGSATKGP